MRFVILGCGRVGAQLANTLCVYGHDVSIIDKNPEAFIRLGTGFSGKAITGIGFDRDILIESGIEQADGFASVTNGDNSNIISALIAKRVFRVPRVITRIYDPLRANIFKQFGIPTISSTLWGANEIRKHLLYQEFSSEISFGSGEAQLMEFEIPLRLVGHSINELQVEGQMSITCLVRFGKAYVPSDATVFEAGDLVYVCVSSDFMGKFKEMVAQ